MIKHSDCKLDIEAIKKYIDDDVVIAPYIYNNIEQYGLDNENVDSWVEYENGIIIAVYLRYFSCVHIYTKDYDINSLIKRVASGILGLKPTTIMVGTKNKEFKSCELNSYSLDKEIIYYKTKQDYFRSKYVVTEGKEEDIFAIAQLMYNDALYKSIYNDIYDIKRQLTDRYNAGYGKLYIIKQNDDIIAFCAINASTDKFSIVGSLVVDKCFRKMGYANAVIGKAWNDILTSKKMIIDMISEDNNASKMLHIKNGFCECGYMYKYRLQH